MPTTKELLKISNVRYFIMFRTCYFARFYYPVFTLLYLDYGLTLSQFALLNTVWAATIVLAEVPSGAFADTLGRKKLVVLSSIIMFIEIALIAFVPTGNPTFLFSIFLINRVLSGLAMALASGADEALAYDTLKEQGHEKEWPQILQTLLRVSSTVSIVVTIVGASMYDLNVMGYIFNFFSFTAPESTKEIMRIPVYATLIVALLALYAAINMVEPKKNNQIKIEDRNNLTNKETKNAKILASLKLTMQTGKWVIATPSVLFILLYYSLFEQTSRMFLTMNSQYYRAIDIPILYFGFIGAGINIMRIVFAGFSRRLAENMKPIHFILMMGLAATLTYFAIGFGFSIYGLIPVLILVFITTTVNMFISYHLNLRTESHHRATVLSFKGLVFNIGYGSIGLLYAYYYALISKGYTKKEIDNDVAFLASLPAFYLYFITLFIILTLLFWRKNRQRKVW
ncbi:MFS transporter [Vibrio sp. SS-MA-C1-2]|uniref:MFS transporter n=1 Tax=Vibrio sp. SS-MA-C1-2 TaxID=2908646 RepID=UPI001F38C93A|nr:MFS transporter [Vibrio sp. SS-MA-C1-2]UJF17889.1 MFS transporter [Vibrio sp. SS-MA-C1-2]